MWKPTTAREMMTHERIAIGNKAISDLIFGTDTDTGATISRVCLFPSVGGPSVSERGQHEAEPTRKWMAADYGCCTSTSTSTSSTKNSGSQKKMATFGEPTSRRETKPEQRRQRRTG